MLHRPYLSQIRIHHLSKNEKKQKKKKSETNIIALSLVTDRLQLCSLHLLELRVSFGLITEDRRAFEGEEVACVSVCGNAEAIASPAGPQRCVRWQALCCVSDPLCKHHQKRKNRHTPQQELKGTCSDYGSWALFPELCAICLRFMLKRLHRSNFLPMTQCSCMLCDLNLRCTFKNKV